MNKLALVQRLKTECGVSGSAPTTTVSQQGEFARLVNWIDAAWMDIQNARPDWQWMRGTCAFPTVAGQATYTATQAGLTDFSDWAHDTFRNYANPVVTLTIASPCVVTYASHGLGVGEAVAFYTDGALPTGITSGTTYYVVSVPSANTFTFSATSGGSAVNTSGSQSGTHTITSNNTTDFAGFGTETYMFYRDYASWRDMYLFNNMRVAPSRPLEITVTPNKAIGLGPIPTAGYTVVGDYYKVASELASDSSSPTLPTQYHMIIVYRAMMMYGGFENAGEVLQRGSNEYVRMMRMLVAHQLPDMDFCGALA